MSKTWMIYGAYGYSGRLIAEEAKKRGMKPVLAGRNGEKTKALATSLELPYRVFSLDNSANTVKNLRDCYLVLHCAGPFSATARPMMDACIATGCHYLDITGEIAVFELGHQLGEQAKAAGVVLCPGVGFDVIPTDCLAASLKARMPDATHLILAFSSRSSFSPGTAKTSVEGLGQGGKIRRHGEIVKVPLAYKTRKIDFGDGEVLTVTIPWGDVSTAFHTTGIPNVEVYIPLSPGMIKKMRRMRLIAPFLGLGFVQNFLKKRIDKKVKGPSLKQRQKNQTLLWGQAANAKGEKVCARMKTANGYEVTVTGALGVVAYLLGYTPQGGYWTPARMLGADFASTLPGSEQVRFET